MSVASLTNRGKTTQFNDVFVALALAMTIAMMITPLPPFLLDILLVLNAGIAFLILLISMYVTHPLQFSVFPSLLLIITLFRLGLNVSASRMILSQAQAGRVIAVFGGLVVGGNYVVGFVVFVMLLVIQFLVITNGAGRVAEVAARFTLDAMPGKQLSVDADLNSGLIDEEEARNRRRMVEQEADFYGSMDGATKFVKGDAIASIVIVVVNVVGGFIIGLVQLDMDIIEALQTYTLLTVGQGLVTQIPSLLISAATGLIVTRSMSDDSLGADVARQLANPNALFAVAGFLALFALLPGIPKPSVMGLAVALGALGMVLRRRESQALAALPQSGEATGPSTVEEPESIKSLLQVDPMTIELGFGLISLVDESREDNLSSRIMALRRQLAMELGFILPKIRITDNLRLTRNQYAVRLRGAMVGRGELIPGRFLAMPVQPDAPELEGIATTEPAFGLPAWWVDDETRQQAELFGYTVVDALSVLITHLSEIIKHHAPQLLSLQDVQELLDHQKKASPATVNDLIPDRLTLPELQEVLRNLLRERISIRDLSTILETLGRHVGSTKDPAVLSEMVRRALSYAISDQCAEEGVLHVATMDPATEAHLSETIHQGVHLRLEPTLAQHLLMSIGESMEALAREGHQPVLLCASEVRLALARFVERALPNLIVLSYNEVSPHVEVQAHCVVNMNPVAEAGTNNHR
ncbi:MAG TPA: flagellar biosynthesis protein FlhA [Chloroflexi bacterium]|jgi:flagellar biosynthesis protein FlhA|nr:flagellar biosynthesis protein FlhA [Chloroflexota bacterium]